MVKFLKCEFLLIFLTCVLFFACANIKAPTGGPKDVIPPKVVRETPSNLTRNFSASNIQIEFDKFVRLNNEFSEISISPAVDKIPTFKAFKKKLDIKFAQTLEENTTYSINFGKAIVDINEGNVLKNYSYVFSTGNIIDSLSINGNVKSAITASGLKDVTVFILPIRQDSLFGKKNANIFTSTDSTGNFTLKNLKGDTYRIYALKKPAGSADRIFNPNTDEIAFLKDSLVLDTNITNVVLNIFKEIPAKMRVLTDRIDTDGKIVLTFNKPADSLTIIDPASFDQKKTVELSAGRDTALIWLPELNFDSLKVIASSKDQSRDTLTLNRSKRDIYTRSVLLSDNIVNGQLNPYSDLVISLTSPSREFDISKITLLQDSVPVKEFQMLKEATSLRKFVFKFLWRPNKSYILTMADSTFTDIFKTKSKNYTRKFKLGSKDDYGNIAIAVTVSDTTKSYLVQWLDEKKSVLRTDAISQNTVIKYSAYPTGKYSLRIVYDANKNGEWDTGNVLSKRQPERIWNYDKIIKLRANWDLEEKMTIPADQ